MRAVAGRLQVLAASIRSRMPGRPAFKDRRVRLGGVALLLAAALAGLFLWNTARAVTAVRHDVADILDSVRGQNLEELTSAQQYADLVRQVRNVERELGGLRTRSVVLQGFQWIPGVGPRIREAVLFERPYSFWRWVNTTPEEPG